MGAAAFVRDLAKVPRFAPALTALAVVIGMLALETGWGAGVDSALLFLGYEIGFLVVPGWLVYRLLASRPGGAIRQLALGWAVGSTLEVFAFMVTAALDFRAAFTVFPLLIAVPAATILARRERAAGRQNALSPPTRRFAWALAGVCLAVMGLLALVFFPAAPLPGSGTFTYFRDDLFHLALAGEALHHWPILDPNVSGQPLPYHYFAHLHMAAASEVTGLNLPLIYFRLFSLPLALLSILLFVTAGMSFARSAWVGLIAAGLTFVVGDIQLQTTQSFAPPFLGVLIPLLTTSPTFLFGLPMFLAMLILIGERVTSADRGSIGDWALIALIAAGSTNAKVVILPLLLIALALFALGKGLRVRRIPWTELAVTMVLLVATGITYFSQYAGHSSGLGAGVFATFNEMPVVASVKDYLGTLVAFPLQSPVLAVAGAILGTFGLLGPQLTGLAWVGRLRGRLNIELGHWWLGAVLLAGILVMFLVTGSAYGGQLYFVFYGLAAGWLLAADGFRRGWQSRPRPATKATARIAAVAIGWLVLLVVVMRAPLDLSLFGGADSQPQTYLFWYGGLTVSLILLSLVTRRFPSRPGWWMGTFVSGALLLAGTIGTVSNYVIPPLGSHSPALPPPSAGPETLTPDAFGALAWIRDNTASSAVLAVNNDDPYNFGYAAFAERPVFLQGWGYTRRAVDAGASPFLPTGSSDLFPERFKLNAQAFAGDPRAVGDLANHFGVRYLVVDSAGGVAANRQRLARLARPVYESPSISVLKVRSKLSSG